LRKHFELKCIRVGRPTLTALLKDVLVDLDGDQVLELSLVPLYSDAMHVALTASWVRLGAYRCWRLEWRDIFLRVITRRMWCSKACLEARIYAWKDAGMEEEMFVQWRVNIRSESIGPLYTTTVRPDGHDVQNILSLTSWRPAIG
jgi:hypothetical protein